MTMAKVLVLATGLLSLCNCTSTTSAEAPPRPEAALCRNDGLDRFVGRKVDQALGAELLNASGARTLRWGPPRSAMTMDFRPDRLTVSYDDAMMVTLASCG